MKHALLAALVLIVAVSPAFSQNAKEASVRPRDGFVPDEKTVVKIGEAVLIPVYGEKQIDSERPLTAKLQGDIWIVTGTLNCGAPLCHGGTAVVKISKASGRILFMTHYK
jgi:hypothetical protein